MLSRRPFGFRVYVGWAAIAIFALMPLISEKLKPIWRLLSWLAPILLALDVDGGNESWIYRSKLVIWVGMEIMCLPMLFFTKGFTDKHPAIFREWCIPVMAVLFIASCTITIIGHHRRVVLRFGGHPPTVDKVGVRTLRYVDPKARTEPYYTTDCLRTPLPTDFVESRYSGNPSNAVIDAVHVSYVTQYAMSRIFKRHNGSVMVYSIVAHYRARCLGFALFAAGVVHVLSELFDKQREKAIVNTALLWLTLPTITLPTLVKIKYGQKAQLKLLLKGLLPAETDADLAMRLGITLQELYYALANANTAEAIMHDTVGIICVTERGERGPVRAADLEVARKYVRNALFKFYLNPLLIRFSDGLIYNKFDPGKAGINVHRYWEEGSPVRAKLNRFSSSRPRPRRTEQAKTLNILPRTLILENQAIARSKDGTEKVSLTPSSSSSSSLLQATTPEPFANERSGPLLLPQTVQSSNPPPPPPPIPCTSYTRTQSIPSSPPLPPPPPPSVPAAPQQLLPPSPPAPPPVPTLTPPVQPIQQTSELEDMEPSTFIERNDTSTVEALRDHPINELGAIGRAGIELLQASGDAVQYAQLPVEGQRTSSEAPRSSGAEQTVANNERRNRLEQRLMFEKQWETVVKEFEANISTLTRNMYRGLDPSHDKEDSLV